MRQLKMSVFRFAFFLSTLTVLIACGSTNTSQGASTGAVVGGLVGGWEGMATGALIGGGVGLMADSAEDKKMRQEQKEKELAQLEKPSVTADIKRPMYPQAVIHLQEIPGVL